MPATGPIVTGMVRDLLPPRADLALATALLVVGELEVATWHRVVGGDWRGAVSQAVIVGCVAWWRRHPVVVALTTTAAMLGAALWTGTLPGSLAGFAVTALAFAGIGALPRRRTAWVALGVALAWGAFMADPWSLNLYLAIVMTSYVVPWTLGALWLRTVQARRLEEERREATARAVADERRRIAQELHDVVSHNVGMIVMQAGAGDVMMSTDPEGTRSSLRAIEEGGRNTLLELRRMLGLLHPDEAALSPAPRIETLPELLDNVRRSGLDVRLIGTVGGRALDHGLELTAYRIVQEALTNVLRHAQATQVEVELGGDPGLLVVEVRDDGVGDRRSEAGGFGLAGLRSRAEVFGGTVTTRANHPHGFVLRAELPVAAP